MDGVTAANPPRPPSADIDARLGRTAASMRPGWVLLRRCRLDGGDGDGAPPPRVRFALLHADVGVALLDLAPELTPDAAARLRRSLDAARFGAAFPGHLPIVHCVVPADRLHRLGEVLDSAFAMEAPLTLRKGYAWVGFVRRVLEADDAAGGQDSQSRHDGELPRVRPAAAAAPPAAGSLVRRRLPGLPALFSLWALLLATFGAGVAVLQSIGLPRPSHPPRVRSHPLQPQRPFRPHLRAPSCRMRVRSWRPPIRTWRIRRATWRPARRRPENRRLRRWGAADRPRP
jgi:hypothetical protein